MPLSFNDNPLKRANRSHTRSCNASAGAQLAIELRGLTQQNVRIEVEEEEPAVSTSIPTTSQPRSMDRYIRTLSAISGAQLSREFRSFLALQSSTTTTFSAEVCSDSGPRSSGMSGISHLVDAQLASRNVEIPNRPVKSASTRSASEMPALAEVASYIAGQEAHRMTLEQLQTHLDTDAIVGLSSVNHAERLESEGPNTLSSPDATSWLGQLLQHFTAGFQLLLLMAAILCLLVYSLTPDDFRNLWLAVVLILVVISTSLFSHYQNTKSEQLLSHFELLTCKEARVVRDGEEFMVNADTLATGDLVTISSGERIPADLVLVQGSGLKVDNSTLTGESEPLPRSTECTDPSLMETKNVVFCGTFVVEGIGRGLVFQKGDKTVIGQVAQCMMVTAKPESHLKQEINLFVRAMACISVLLGLIFFIVALLIIRQDIVTAITFCIGIIIANVPEGLLPQLTIQLYITASKLRSRNVLVKNLEMVETLGCISCIACDKTGTLTQNQMATSHLMIGGVIFCAHSLSGDKYPECNYTDRGFQLLCEVAQLSSETAPNRTTGGGTTELAVVKYFAQYNNLEAHREEHRRVAILPFSSSNKWMLTICVDPETPNGVCVYMKGAPERVIERCSTAILGGETVPISSLAPQVEQCNTELCALGERVLGFAFARLDPALYPATYPFDVNTMNFPLTELCFAGLVSLVDPPRPEAAAAIRTCRKAGMKLLMVTGDHPVTAEAIARSVGILRPRPNNSSPSWNPEDVAPISEELGIVVNGEELGSYTPKDWDEALSKEGMVFARTLPQQKQMIVANLQARGHMVAVTGDGVNDSPALKQASCGIAMGSVGADIAKDAADIILLDDNFTSIVAGIKEGRVVYANMQKCIILVLSHLIPEVLPFILFITAGLPLGLNIVMLLVVDLCTDMLGAIALAWEPGETVVMDKPPRHVTDRLASYRLFLLAYLQAGALEAAMGFLIYCVIFAEYGFALGDLVGTASIWSLSDDALSDTALQKLALLASSNPLWQARTGPAADFESFTAYRIDALRSVQTGWLCAILIGQAGNLLSCRTQYTSLFHSPPRNWRLLVMFVLSLALLPILVYTTVGWTLLSTRPIPGRYIGYCVPLFFVLLLCDELRKWCLRRWPGGWCAYLTAY